MKEVKRCSWVPKNLPLYIKYHDKEWGKPIKNSKKLFEMLCLEGAQAGLTWWTVLQKRENYRKAYDNFDPVKIAKYTDKKQEKLLQNSGIIRNRLKVNAFRENARAYLEIEKEFGSFSKYIWSFADGKQIQNKFKSLKEIPATTKISDAMSKDLKKRDFKFVGPTICYAFMQAVGMVNDHEVGCFIYGKFNR